MSGLLGNFHFIRPLSLWLAPLAVALWWAWQRRADPLGGWREQMDPALLDALVVGRTSGRSGSAGWLLVAWLVAILALASPTWQLEPSPFGDDASPVLILLKADASMDRPDPAPSRIERTRLKITDLAALRKGQPLGLIAYAGSAHLVLPPTRDTAAVARMAMEISPAIMPRSGDRLDLAVKLAAKTLAGKSATLVVMADSVQGDPAALTEAVRASGLRVIFLAINTPESEEAASLQQAARATGATVQLLTADETDVKNLVRLAAHAPVARADEIGNRWQETGWFLVPIVALIFLASFRRETSPQKALA